MSKKEPTTATCEFCKKRIEIRSGNFVHVYIVPPLIHAYHLECYKTLIINDFFVHQQQTNIKQVVETLTRSMKINRDDLLKLRAVYTKINGEENEQSK
jgi:hypothetical protein